MSSHAPRIAPPSGRGPFYGTSLDVEIDELARVAMRAKRLDPIVTEVVRLRCAGYHDCRICGSLRMPDALAAGLDDDAAAQIADYERSGLDERLKVALRFVDAILIDPESVDAELVAQLSAYYSPEEVAELSFDVVKWSLQKALVALRLEEPPWEGLASLSFDENGDAVVAKGVASSR